MLPTWRDGRRQRSKVHGATIRRPGQLIVRHSPVRQATVAGGSAQPDHLLQGVVWPADQMIMGHSNPMICSMIAADPNDTNMQAEETSFR